MTYFLVMAATVAEYYQSDELYLMKLSDGRVIGYSSEFQYSTCDIQQACSLETSHLAKWFGLPEKELKQWIPATLNEIKLLRLEEYLIGSRSDMEPDTLIDPL